MQSPERALWSSVIMQALGDIEAEPIGSVDYNQARDFLISPGEWGQSRASAAEMIGFHADDIRNAGLRQIATRRALEGLPPDPASLPKVGVALPVRLPRLVAVPARPKIKREDLTASGSAASGSVRLPHVWSGKPALVFAPPLRRQGKLRNQVRENNPFARRFATK